MSAIPYTPPTDGNPADLTPEGRDEGSTDQDQPYQRFRIVTQEEEHLWSLKEGMLTYVKENFEKYIPEKYIKDGILLNNPRPQNLVQAKKLDDYLITLMKDKHKTQELTVETTLEKIQNRNLDVMGPLSKLWQAVDTVTSHKEGEEEPPQLSIGEAQTLIEQSILLVGQTHNFLLYERRKNILNSLMNAHSGSTTLKEQADLLTKSDTLLFGNEFRDHIVDSLKAKRKSMEAFSTESPSSKKPFSPSPSYKRPPYKNNYGGQNYRRDGGGRSRGNFNHRRGTYFFTRISTFSQQPTASTVDGLGEINSCPPIYKTAFRTSTHTGCPPTGKVKTLPPSVENSDKGRTNTLHSREFQNTLIIKTNTGKSSMSHKNKLGARKTNSCGSSGNVAKRCDIPCFKRSGRIFKQYISSSKERWRLSASDKFEEFESICPLRALQNGRVTLSQRYFTTRRLYVQNRLEGCIFQHTFGPGIQKIYSFFLERKSLRVLMPLFRIRPGSKNFHKITESSNSHPQEVEYQSDNLPGRSSNFGVLKGRSDRIKGHCDLFTSTFGVCDKSKEVCIRTNSGDSFPGNDSEFNFHDFSINSRKVTKGEHPMHCNAEQSNNKCLRTDKVDRSIIFNLSSCDASKTSISVSSEYPNSVTKSKPQLHETNKVDRASSERTNLVVRKSKTSKWEVHNPCKKPSNSSNRCIEKRVGRLLPRDKNRWPLVPGRTETPYQHPRVVSNQVCNSIHLQDKENSLPSYSGGQSSGLVLPLKDGEGQRHWR